MAADVVRLRDGSYSVAYPETQDGAEYALVILSLNEFTDRYIWTCLRCRRIDCADVGEVQRFRRQACIDDSP